MSSDPLLKAAIAHWGARFVANGVVLTDFEEITGRSVVLRRLVPGLVGTRRPPRGNSAAKRWRPSISSPPANVCSGPRSTIISARFCSRTIRRR